MGFLDSLKGIAKDVAKNVIEDVVKEATEKAGVNTPPIQETGSYSGSQAGKPGQESEAETIHFQPVTMPDSQCCEFMAYECDDAGNDKEYSYRFMLPAGFVEFSSGAGEIDAAYIYSPEGAVDGYADDLDKPILYLGNDGPNERVLDRYLKHGRIEPGCEAAKVENSIAEYKTSLVLGGHLLIAYHFYSKYQKDIYKQIVLQIPPALKHTELGKMAEQGLDLIVSTLTFGEEDECGK